MLAHPDTHLLENLRRQFEHDSLCYPFASCALIADCGDCPDEWLSDQGIFADWELAFVESPTAHGTPTAPEWYCVVEPEFYNHGWQQFCARAKEASRWLQVYRPDLCESRCRVMFSDALGVELPPNSIDEEGTATWKASTSVQGIANRKSEVVQHLASQACGDLHIHPERWNRRDGMAYCPACERFMGRVQQ